MRISSGFELALAALAVIAGAAIMVPIWLGGSIAPGSVGADLLIVGLMLALVIAGALLDVFASGVGGRIAGLALLSLGAVALSAWFVLSFMISFGGAAVLAIAAAIVGWVRLASSRAATLPTR